MNAGKHVLVEKPAAVSARDFREMSECAKKNGVFLMEACWTYFFPAIKFAQKCIADGQIGEVRALNCSFSFRVPDEYQGRLTRPENAGGGLLDVGVYDLHMAQIVYGKDPVSIRGLASVNTDQLHLMVDEQAAFIAQYDRGELAVMSSGIRTDMLDTAYIYGTEGYITVPRFWSPDRVLVTRGGKTEEFSFPVEQKVNGLVDEGYQYEISHVNDCLRNGLQESPVVTHDRTLSVLSQCDALRHNWGLA
jgi:predicted dehydrogenase